MFGAIAFFHYFASYLANTEECIKEEDKRFDVAFPYLQAIFYLEVVLIICVLLSCCIGYCNTNDEQNANENN